MGGPRIRKRLVLLALVCLLCWPEVIAGGDGSPLRALVRTVRGEVQMQSEHGDWRPVTEGQVLSAGDRVRVAEGAEVDLIFPQGVVALVLGEASFELPVKGSVWWRMRQRAANLRITLGKAWFYVVAKIAGERPFNIQTPTAVTGVRGTFFSLKVDAEGETDLGVHSGSVEFAGRQQKFIVNAGSKSRADQAGVVRAPAPLDPEERAEGEKYLRIVKAKAKPAKKHPQEKNGPGKESSSQKNNRGENGPSEGPQGPPDGIPDGPPGNVPKGPPENVPKGPPENVPKGQGPFDEGPPGWLKPKKEPPGQVKKQSTK
jgi:hypothetical protein